MTTFRSDFLRTLDERGFIHQISDADGLDKLLATETVTAYIGFDPTAPSLHAGGLIQIISGSVLGKCPETLEKGDVSWAALAPMVVLFGLYAASGLLFRLLGRPGIEIISRVFGLILASIAVNGLIMAIKLSFGLS